MIVYCVMHDDDSTGTTNIVSIHKTLESAELQAKRHICDEWRVQDGYQYETIFRPNGTNCFVCKDVMYSVEIYEVKE